MKQIIKKLILTYLIVVFVKIVFSFFISSPTGFWDEYIYAKVGRSFYYFNNFNIEQNPSPFYPPLYSILISIAYLLKDMDLVYLAMKIINAFVSSMIIIPAYLLSKELLKENQQIYVPILILFLPSNFSFSSYLLSENLFYPLFLSAIYFIYKTLKENNLKNNILSSIFISLSYLTRSIGLILIGIYFLSHLTNWIISKEKLQFRNLILSGFVMALIISPWLIRNYIEFGLTIKNILGWSASDNVKAVSRYKDFFIPAFATWVIIYTVALSLMSGLIFFFSSFFTLKHIKDKNNIHYFLILAIITVVSYVLVLANNALGPQPENLPRIFHFLTGRPILRYIEMLNPMIIILGTVGLNNFYETQNKKLLRNIVILSIPFFIIASQLVIYPLTPINNLSLSNIGLIVVILNYLTQSKLLFNFVNYIIMLSFFIILPFSTFLINKLSFKQIFCLILSLFILTNIINFGINYYQADKWSNEEQIKISKWFNENDEKISNVLIDERYIGNPLINKSALYNKLGDEQYLTLMGFWINDNLFFGNIKKTNNMDYIITKEKLNLNLVKQEGHINIYRVNS